MFKLSPKMWYLLKYGFLILIFMGVILTILPVSKPKKGLHWLDMLAENFSDSEINMKFSLDILREDVTDCLINFKERTEGRYPLKTEHTWNISKNSSSDALNDEHSIFTVLSSFNNILSLIHIKAVIIEPSILYCMLLPKYQELLSKKHFNVLDFSKSNRIITYGIMEQDVVILQQKRNIHKFSIMNFKVHFMESPLPDWMQVKDPTTELNSFYSHIFFKHETCMIHIVVFRKRNQYVWHAALDIPDDEKAIWKDKLLFSNHNGAHEKFLFVPLENKVLPIADFYVPSNTHYFLFEMLSSRFLECDISRAETVFSTSQPRSHPHMSIERFNRRTRFALRELKKIFHPLLMHLWIWSGTMLGWYRQCDIIPYTTDVDFASWASDIDDLDKIIKMLQRNKYITIDLRMGFLQEALEFQLDCHDLRTDVFFMYQIVNGSWCSGHRPKLGYYFRYFYPPFTLCSCDLLGEKIEVPCETEDVITTEYGPDWRKPISSWHYEISPKNRGPMIYWDKQMLKYAYHTF